MSKKIDDINEALDTFGRQMSLRMHQKRREGFTGWQQPQNFNVAQRLLMKAARVATDNKPSKKDLVDIANLTMMLYVKAEKDERNEDD